MLTTDVNILYISFPTAYPGTDGGAAHVAGVADHLVKRGHSVTLLVDLERGQPVSETHDRLRIFRTPSRILCRKTPMSDYGVVKHLPQLRKGGRFDCIIERQLLFGGIGAVLARMWKVPLLLEVNTALFDEGIHVNGIRNPLVKFLCERMRRCQFRHCDRIIVTSPSIISDFAHVKTEIVNWGTDSNRFPPDLRYGPDVKRLRHELTISGKFVVLFLSSDVSAKGLGDFLRIVQETKERVSSAVFLVVGIAQDSWIADQIDRLNLGESCRFVGKVPASRVPDYCAVSDVGLATYNTRLYPPMQKYGFYLNPIKILDYQASGLPVVAPYYPVMDKIARPDETGLFVEEGNIDQYVTALKKLSDDRHLREKMGCHGRKLAAEELGWDAHVEHLERILNQMIHDYHAERQRP